LNKKGKGASKKKKCNKGVFRARRKISTSMVRGGQARGYSRMLRVTSIKMVNEGETRKAGTPGSTHARKKPTGPEHGTWDLRASARFEKTVGVLVEKNRGGIETPETIVSVQKGSF